MLRPALREGVDELRLSDLTDVEDLVAPETSFPADLADFDAVLRGGRRASTPSSTSARCPTRRRSSRSPARTCTAPSTSSRPAGARGVQRVVFASSNHATGMYPVGAPLDGTVTPRPDGIYGASKVWGEALGRMFVRPLRAVRGLPADRLLPASARARSASSSTWLSARRRRAARAGGADRRRRLRDRLRRVGQHAPLVAAGHGDRLRPARRRRGLRATACRRRSTPSRAARTRRRDHGGWAT